MKIIRAMTSRHMELVRRLFREYEVFLAENLRFQDFEGEVASLPGEYAPPDGVLLLALAEKGDGGAGISGAGAAEGNGSQSGARGLSGYGGRGPGRCGKERAAGCVAVKKLAEGECEMKRLFVRKEYRGRGLGRELAVRAVDEAQKLGYSVMRLDTLEKLKEALALYLSLGFREIGPYYYNPLEDVVYLELKL